MSKGKLPNGGNTQKKIDSPMSFEKNGKPVPDKGRRASIIFISMIAVALIAFSVAVCTGWATPVLNPNPTQTTPTQSAKPAKPGATATPLPVAVSGCPEITEVMSSNKGSITAQDGNYYDWIELYNPTDAAIDLAGFALSDNLKKPTKCVLPDYILGPGKYVLVYASGQMASTKGELQAGFKLNSSGQTVIMTDPNGNKIQTVSYPAMKADESWAMMEAGSPGKWALTDKYTPGFPNTDEGYAAYQQTRRATAPIVLSEVMAGNTMTIKDSDGDYSDWLELYNPTDKEVDLTGWGLSNKESQPKRWVFPQTKIGPKQYLIVFLSGKNRSVAGGELHTDFRLNANKGTILLANLQGQIVSETSFSSLKADTSWGLAPGSDKWQEFTHPTPGYPNNSEGWNAFQPKLYSDVTGPILINEIMSENAVTVKDQFNEYPDWIELYNRSDKSVDLKGYGLTDKANEPGRWQFPDITMKPGEYLVVFASGRNLADADAVTKRQLHTDFSIGVGGGIVELTAPGGQIADRCFLPALQMGLSYGRAAGSMLFSYYGTPTPGKANATGAAGITPDPAFSLKAGMYKAAQTVSLSTGDPNSSIYYTLDGKIPTKNSKLYSGPISMPKTTVIRAIAVRSGYLQSGDVCSTYLINEGISLPVVSIVTDPNNITTIDNNIYKELEEPAHAELLEPNGTVGFSQDIGIKIFGGVSKRNNAEKAYALMARSKYGKNSFDYAVFPDQPYTDYKDLVIRDSGQDANLSRIRDILQVGLARETTNVDGQDHRQSIVFINGVFWGVYDIVEKVNNHFIAQHYNLDPDKIDLLGANGTVINGSNTDYNALVSYIHTHDMTNAKNYDYVASKIDIDNYIDWCCVEIFTVNSDLGNVKFWKPQTPDGKWRWILYDMDWGYYFINQNPYYLDPFKRFFDPRGNGIGNNFDNSIVRALIKNPVFKEKFLERFAYVCNVTFKTSTVLKRTDELVANIEPYMQRDKTKWHRGTVAGWKNGQIKLIKDFAQQRVTMNKQCFQAYFHLSNTKMNELFK